MGFLIAMAKCHAMRLRNHEAHPMPLNNDSNRACVYMCYHMRNGLHDGNTPLQEIRMRKNKSQHYVRGG